MTETRIAVQENNQLVELYLDRIARIDPELSSFVTVCAEEARAQATEVDAARAAGLGPVGQHHVQLGVVVLAADRAASSVSVTRSMHSSSSARLKGFRKKPATASSNARLRMLAVS